MMLVADRQGRFRPAPRTAEGDVILPVGASAEEFLRGLTGNGGFSRLAPGAIDAAGAEDIA